MVNYHRHYKNNLNIIEEENSIAEYSELYVRRLSKNNTSFDDDGDMLIPIESARPSHRDSRDILAPNVYRKDSVYYTDQNEDILKGKPDKEEGTVFDFKKANQKKNQ